MCYYFVLFYFLARVNWRYGRAWSWTGTRSKRESRRNSWGRNAGKERRFRRRESKWRREIAIERLYMSRNSCVAMYVRLLLGPRWLPCNWPGPAGLSIAKANDAYNLFGACVSWRSLLYTIWIGYSVQVRTSSRHAQSEVGYLTVPVVLLYHAYVSMHHVIYVYILVALWLKVISAINENISNNRVTIVHGSGARGLETKQSKANELGRP